MGFGDWQNYTPYYNTIDNFMGNDRRLRLRNGKEITSLEKWYFYKEYIVCVVSQGYKDPKLRFLVINEVSSKIHEFETEKEWNTFLEDNRLVPLVWTRWHSGDWVAYDDLLFLTIFLFFISIPLGVLYVLMAIKAFRREDFDPRKPFTLITIAIPMLLFQMYLFDIFPQSI
ncbi:MAG: hypothetical protein AAF740_14515 [Bacteroidota bacterium]